MTDLEFQYGLESAIKEVLDGLDADKQSFYNGLSVAEKRRLANALRIAKESCIIKRPFWSDVNRTVSFNRDAYQNAKIDLGLDSPPVIFESYKFDTLIEAMDGLDSFIKNQYDWEKERNPLKGCLKVSAKPHTNAERKKSLLELAKYSPTWWEFIPKENPKSLF